MAMAVPGCISRDPSWLPAGSFLIPTKELDSFGQIQLRPAKRPSDLEARHQKRRSPRGAGFASARLHQGNLVAEARFELATFGL
jgi:hypothetical protein